MGQQKVKEEKTKERGDKKEQPKAAPEKKKISKIIRLVETNLDGDRPVKIAIRNIKGVSFMLSNAVNSVSGLGDKKLGDLSEEELKKLEDIITHPEKYNIPAWLYNRKLDPDTGENSHLTVSKLIFAKNMDINKMKKLKIYKGIRHQAKLPVRGQRTKGSFRKGTIVGVKRKASAKKGKV